MKFRSLAVPLTLLLLLVTSGSARAQGVGSLAGRVTDASTRQPLSGVEVRVQGTQTRVATGVDGRYLLPNLPAGNQTIVVSMIGYATETMSTRVGAGATAQMNVELKTEALKLQELVVTGVVDPVEGVKLPFVVNKISGENLNAVPATGSALAAIQGKVAGVHIIRSSGQPGSGVSIMMRTPTTVLGSASPLYVVDGVIVGTTLDIETLDIESMELIKGAAGASLYGSQGGAGVVQITTRRGRDLAIGTTRMEMTTEYGLSQLPNGRPAMATHHAYRINTGVSYTDNAGQLVNPGDYIDAAGNKVSRAQRAVENLGFLDRAYNERLYDNLGALFVPGRFLTSNFSLSQNFEKTNYTISVNARDQAGALKNNDGFQRYSGKVNLDHRFSEDVVLQLSGYHFRSHSDMISGTPFSQLLYYDPTVNLAARDSAGNYIAYPDPDYSMENPIWRETTRDNWSKREGTQASATLRYSPTKWLRVFGQYSYDRVRADSQIYVPKGVPTAPFEADPTDGRLYFVQDGRDSQNGSLQVTLSRPFGAFNPRLTLGSTFETFDRLYFNADGRNLAVKGLRDIDLAIDKTRMSSIVQQERAAGFLADLAADYAGKYIGSFIIRREGSSRYGADRRWHTYAPARAAFAYRISEEAWWPLKNTITEFKPRIAIGTSGGRPTYNQQYETWAVSIPAGGSPTFSRGNAGNPLLSPERTFEREFGLDFTLFNNHEFRLTYVRQDTEDNILQGVGPAAEGYFSRWENIGATAGKSYEFEYSARLMTRPSFSWNTTVVADRNDSWYTRWDRPSYPSGIRQFGLEGTLYDMWGRYMLRSSKELESKGRIPAQFHDQFDVNDDGYVVWVGQGNTWRDGISKNLWGTSANVGGRVYQWGMAIPERTEAGDIAWVKIGTSRPDFNYGFLNNLRYKNLSIHTHLRGQVGGNIYGDIRQLLYNQLRHGDVDQSGKPDERKKPVSYYRSTGLYQDYASSSTFVEDATFLKVSSVKVDYRFSQQQMQRLLGRQAPSSLTIGLSGRNLYTLSNYSGWDPDVGTSPTLRIDGINTYPNMREWTTEVRITF